MNNFEKFPDFNLQLSLIIRDKMRELRLNQTQLAKKVGVSPPQINKYLGDNNYTLKSAQRILEAMGYHPVLTVTRKTKDE